MAAKNRRAWGTIKPQPGQYFYDDIITEQRAAAERRLWIRVLEFAIEDMMNGHEQEIIQWIETAQFRNVCRAAGCAPGRASSHIAKLYQLNFNQEAVSAR